MRIENCKLGIVWKATLALTSALSHEERIPGIHSHIERLNRGRTAPVPIGQAQWSVPEPGRAGCNARGRSGPLRLVLAHTAAIQFMEKAGVRVREPAANESSARLELPLVMRPSIRFNPAGRC